MFAEGAGPEALFCANDLMAMGAIDALRQKIGLRVPDDVLVAGFDDVPMASWAAYDLTTVVQDAQLMVEQSVELLCAVMTKHDESSGSCKTVPAALVIRGSTGRQA
jgi:DNA-binding LacI/PurR family transcriptional regulator